MRCLRFPILLLFVFGIGWAQDAQLRGPTASLLYDAASRSIRPMLGVPGAAVLGLPVSGGLDWGDAAPNGKWGLGVQAGQLVYLSGLDAAVTVTPLTALTSVDLIAWSADSKFAALYSAAGRQLLTITGLDSTPQPGTLDISSLAGDVRFLLADAAARQVILGLANAGAGSGLYGIGLAGGPGLLAQITDPRAAAFLNKGKDLAIVDAGTRQVFELLDFRGAANLVPFADLADGDSQPVGVCSSTDRIFVADQASSSVSVFDLASSQLIARLSVDVPPVTLRKLGHSSLYLLGGGGADPLYLLDSGRNAAVYFIPKGTGE